MMLRRAAGPIFLAIFMASVAAAGGSGAFAQDAPAPAGQAETVPAPAAPDSTTTQGSPTMPASPVPTSMDSTATSSSPASPEPAGTTQAAPAQADAAPRIPALPAGAGPEGWYYLAKKLETTGSAPGVDTAAWTDAQRDIVLETLYSLAFRLGESTAAKEAGRELIKRYAASNRGALAADVAAEWMDNFGPDWSVRRSLIDILASDGNSGAALAEVAALKAAHPATAKSKASEMAWLEISLRQALGNPAWISLAEPWLRTSAPDQWSAKILGLLAAGDGPSAAIAAMRLGVYRKDYASARTAALRAADALRDPGIPRAWISEAGKALVNSGGGPEAAALLSSIAFGTPAFPPAAPSTAPLTAPLAPPAEPPATPLATPPTSPSAVQSADPSPMPSAAPPGAVSGLPAATPSEVSPAAQPAGPSSAPSSNPPGATPGPPSTASSSGQSAPPPQMPAYALPDPLPSALPERRWVAAFHLGRVLQLSDRASAGMLFLALSASAPSPADADSALWYWLDQAVADAGVAAFDERLLPPGSDGEASLRRSMGTAAIVTASVLWKNPSWFDDILDPYLRSLMTAKAWDDVLRYSLLLSGRSSTTLATRMDYISGRLLELKMASAPESEPSVTAAAFFNRLIARPKADEYYRSLAAWRLGEEPPFLAALPSAPAPLPTPVFAPLPPIQADPEPALPPPASAPADAPEAQASPTASATASAASPMPASATASVTASATATSGTSLATPPPNANSTETAIAAAASAPPSDNKAAPAAVAAIPAAPAPIAPPPGSEEEFVVGFIDSDLPDLAATRALSGIGAAEASVEARLAEQLSAEGKHYAALRLARDAAARLGPKADPALQRLVYPRPWSDKVAEVARKADIPEPLVYGIVRSESMFNPNAVSSSGAMGLSQLMPATAKEQARNLGMKSYSITDPADNLRIGMAFYDGMLARFGERPMRAMFAYNAGPGRMARWKTESDELPDDLLLETLHIAETRQYGKNIVQAVLAYCRIHYGIDPLAMLDYLVEGKRPAIPAVDGDATPGSVPQAASAGANGAVPGSPVRPAVPSPAGPGAAQDSVAGTDGTIPAASPAADPVPVQGAGGHVVP